MHYINRRNVLKATLGGLGSMALNSNLLAQINPRPSFANISGGPKRVVFFLQNQGFEPKTCIPVGMQKSGSLANATLPEPIQALQPHREKFILLMAFTAGMLLLRIVRSLVL